MMLNGVHMLKYEKMFDLVISVSSEKHELDMWLRVLHFVPKLS